MLVQLVGGQSPLKNSGSHIDAPHSRQPLVKGERLVRYEVNAVMTKFIHKGQACLAKLFFAMFLRIAVFDLHLSGLCRSASPLATAINPRCNSNICNCCSLGKCKDKAAPDEVRSPPPQPAVPNVSLTIARVCVLVVGGLSPLKNSGSHIDASHSRQPLVKGERLVRYEVNAVMPR